MNQVFQQAYGFEAKPDKRFEDFVIETFLPYSEANKKSFYSDVLLCRVLVSRFKGKTLRQISPPVIESFKQEFLNHPTKPGKKRSPATVNHHLSVLSKIFSLAVEAEPVETNPCFRVRKFQLNNQRLRFLSKDEEERLFVALGELDEAKIKNFRFHDLRHTAATGMADSGADVFTLAKISGHSDIRMTSRYTHATDAALRRAVTNLDANSDFSHESVTKQKRQAEGSP